MLDKKKTHKDLYQFDGSTARPDAIIVLANLMEADASLNSESALRAEKAAEVFRQTQARRIVTCGWAYRTDCQQTVAEAFREHLIRVHGLVEGNIAIEVHSRDTVGDAVFTRINFAQKFNWTSIIVVTSEYHVKRTAEIFSFVYGKDVKIHVVGAKVDVQSSILEHENRSIKAFRRTFSGVPEGDLHAIFGALRQHHPYYNGEVYPQIDSIQIPLNQ